MNQPPSRGGHVAKSLATRALLWGSAGTVATVAALAAVALLTVLMIVGAKSVADQQACGGGELTEISLSGVGESEIPARLLPIYRDAAEHYELGRDGYLWLAAVNRVETHFGTNLNVSSAGAVGWMQFMPATWAAYGVDADGDGTKDPWKPKDAIYGAANYLHASGAPGDWHKAVLAYNHAEWYFLDVQGFKERYGKGGSSSPSAAPATVAADDGDATAGGATTSAPGPAVPAGGQAGELARGREGTVAFAMADRSGEIRASLRGDRPFNSASLTKAMLLVAALRDRGKRPVPAAQRATLEAMIAASDNGAANRVLAQVGTGGVREVARVARMTGFRLSTADPVYRLGDSKITANDQARFFARIDLLMPRAQRQLGLELLASKVPGQRWGMLNAQISGTIYSKAGWRPEHTGGWTVNQAVRIDTPEGVRGIAVLSDGGPSQEYGQTTMAQVGGALARGGADGTGIDDVLGGCATAGATDPGADVQLTEGGRAKLLPDGTAAAPANAPPAVKAMVAAGNRIQGRPYVYGGGHGSDLREISPNNYDCSSSISYILYWGGFIANPRGTMVSGPLGSSFGAPGPGKWVTIRGNAGHVYMYVAGLRWDTHRYGAQDTGVAGVGWHTAVRSDAASFGARHPGGL